MASDTPVSTIMTSDLVTAVARPERARGRRRAGRARRSARLRSSTAAKLVGLLRDEDLIVSEANLHVPTVIEFLGADLVWPASERRWEKELKKAAASTVGDVMTTEFPTVAPTDSVEKVATIMHDEGVSHVPVVEDDRVVGHRRTRRPRPPPRGHHVTRAPRRGPRGLERGRSRRGPRRTSARCVRRSRPPTCSRWSRPTGTGTARRRSRARGARRRRAVARRRARRGRCAAARPWNRRADPVAVGGAGVGRRGGRHALDHAGRVHRGRRRRAGQGGRRVRWSRPSLGAPQGRHGHAPGRLRPRRMRSPSSSAIDAQQRARPRRCLHPPRGGRRARRSVHRRAARAVRRDARRARGARLRRSGSCTRRTPPPRSPVPRPRYDLVRIGIAALRAPAGTVVRGPRRAPAGLVAARSRDDGARARRRRAAVVRAQVPGEPARPDRDGVSRLRRRRAAQPRARGW